MSLMPAMLALSLSVSPDSFWLLQAAQRILGGANEEVDFQPQTALAAVVPAFDIVEWRATLPDEPVHGSISNLWLQKTPLGQMALVAYLQGEVASILSHLQTLEGVTSPFDEPQVTLAVAPSIPPDLMDDFQRVLKGRVIWFDTMQVLDLATGDVVDTFILDETEDTDDDDD